MRSGLSVAHNGARAAFAGIGRDGIDANTHLPQRITDQSRLRSSDESCKHDIAAQLPEHTRNIAPFASRLSQNGPAALDFRGLEIVDLNDAVDAEVGTDDEEHPRNFTSYLLAA